MSSPADKTKNPAGEALSPEEQEMDLGGAPSGGVEMDLGVGTVKAAAVSNEEDEPASSGGGKGLFMEALGHHDTFRLPRKAKRHILAHREYGVVFSLCGIRTTIKEVEMNPEFKAGETLCVECKIHWKGDRKAL